MNVKIELNESSSNLISASKTAIDAGAGETLEEAFSRILSAKTVSDTDRKRILAVKEALEEGEITREQKAYEKGRKLSKAEVLRLYKIVEERSQERILNEMKESMPDNYRLITDEDSLLYMVAELNDEQTIVFDVETTGTDIWSDCIVGHVLSAVKADKHYYIPTKHDTTETQLDHDYVLSVLKPIYEDETTLKIGHNLKYDIHMLRNEGITVRGELWDTQEAMRLLNENEPSYALKTLVSKFLKIPSLTYGQLFGKKGFNEVSDLTVATSYAAKDGDVTYALYEFQRKQLEERFPTIYQYAKEIEMPLLYAVVEMERTGFVIDQEYAESYGDELLIEIAASEDRIKKVFGEINLNSPSQVKPAIEAHIGRSIPNTDAKKTLKPLAKDYVVVEELLHYKELTKLYGTYVSKLPTLISEKTGRLMVHYNQNGAATGRFSSSGGVNIQNQSPEARKMYVAPEGKVIIGADFKAQEIRCVAYLSQEPVLISAFKEKRDPYAMMASNFYGKPYEEVYKNADGSDTKERKQMKVVWLATLYGMSVVSLADMLGVDKKDAEKLQTDLFASMPKLNAWIEQTKAFVQRHGYVWMDKQQRKRRLPEATAQRIDIPYGKYYDPAYEKDRMHNAGISRALRQAPNACVQGASAIQTKATLIRMQQECAKRDGWRLWATIHDELIIEIPEDFTEDDTKVIESCMLYSYPWGDNVPNGTDLEVMTRWGEGMTVDEWFKRKEAQ